MANNKATYTIELKDKFSGGFGKINKSMNGFERRVDGVAGRRGRGGKLGGLAGGLGAVARVAGGLGLAIGAAGLAKDVAQLGIKAEQTKVAFATMFGSVEAGNAVFDKMNEFSNVTPFSNDKVLQSAKTLAAFGFEADQLEPTLKLIGDVSAGTGKDLSEMAVIFGQIKSAGRLMGQDLLQLINAGFNPLQVMSEKTGRSVSDLKDDMSKGLITFDDVTQAFSDATGEGGKFFNMMEKQSQTVGGRLSTLQGKLQLIGMKLGQAVLPILGKVIDGVLKFTDHLMSIDYTPFQMIFTSIGDSLRVVWSAITDIFGAIGGGEFDLLQTVMDGIAIAFRASTLPMRVFATGLTTLRDIAGEVATSFSALGDILIGAVTFDKDRIDRGVDTLTTAVKQGFTKIKSNAMDFVKDEAKFLDSIFNRQPAEKKEAFDLSSISKTATPSASTTATSSASSASRQKLSSGVTGSGPKNVSLNVNKLIETINFNSSNFAQSKQELQEQIKQALLTSLNDTVIAST